MVTRSSACRLRYLRRLVHVLTCTWMPSKSRETGLVDMRPSGRMVVMKAIGVPSSRGRAYSGIGAPVGNASTTGLPAGFGETEVALGDVVAVDLARSAIDGADHRVPGVVVDEAVRRRPRLVELGEPLG